MIQKIFLRFYNYFYYNVFLHVLIRIYPYYLKFLIPRIRKKEEIKVLFVVGELPSWKSERLYNKMLSHSRFNPLLAITDSVIIKDSKSRLLEYIKNKGYEYIDIDQLANGISVIKPDLIFYYKPYDQWVLPQHRYIKHLNIPCLFINYSLTLQKTEVGLNQLMHNLAWMIFDENLDVNKARREIAINKGVNTIITGVPVQDDLMTDKSYYKDPWKHQDKKRIIYAPHHSLPGTNNGSVEFSTFLLFGEFILQLAEKYKEETCWAFKPHPSLYDKLINVWGENRTNKYYSRWNEIENGQVEFGEYMGLFKYSDAMIHDCGSFVMEYLYINKPVMFLMYRSPEEHLKEQNDFGKKAFNVHEHGYKNGDIEHFVLDVINGVDKKRNERIAFMQQCLIPPHGNTACDNIIDAILGNIEI